MYSTEQLADITGSMSHAIKEANNLRLRIVAHTFRTPLGQEFALQGLLRRMRTLKRCISNVFELFPPTQAAPLPVDKREDAEINLQSFVFNTAGCLDNLAWIWVHEMDVRGKNGKAFSYNQVGLGRSCTSLRATLSGSLQVYLSSIDGWFRQQEDYRHSLAHRIPLYLPPYFIAPGDVDLHYSLDVQANSAARVGNQAEYDRLSAEQRELGIAGSLMRHDPRSRPVIVHAMLIADFRTVSEIGTRFMHSIG